MARPMVIYQQKLAEKLTILRSRGEGMLTRIYNIKKACGDQKSKPAFLSDKSLEASVKYIVRKFPNIDPKQLSNVQPLRNEVLKSLSLYYYTFVDLLDFKVGWFFIVPTNYAVWITYVEVRKATFIYKYCSRNFISKHLLKSLLPNFNGLFLHS